MSGSRVTASEWELNADEFARAQAIADQCLDISWQNDSISTPLEQADIKWLFQKATQVHLLQPTVLHLAAPIQIVGDIHGQYLDLLRIFKVGGFPPEKNYLFLGDYVDRGKNGIECLALLMSIKVRFPDNIFLLRGNHECDNVNQIYGFQTECKKRFSLSVWETSNDLFCALPLAAIVAEKIFCIHGGLSPKLESIEQIEQIQRPLIVDNRGMVIDFLWSDPDADVRGWAESDRGISYVFGGDIIKEFLERHNFELLIRAHQVVEAGYELFADRQLVTLFSAPNYCGEFDNAGATVLVKKNLECHFQVLAPILDSGFQYSYAGRPKTPLLD